MDVQGKLPQRRFEAETTPTIEQVLGFIEDRSRELDVYLGQNGYAVPAVEATSPVAWGWLKAAVGYGAAMDAESAAFPGQGDRGETPRLAFLRGQWERMIKALEDDSITLVDLPRDTGSDARTVRSRTRATAFFRAEMSRDGLW